MRSSLPLLLWAALAAAGCGDARDGGESHVLRVGHFATVTHAQGVIGHRRTRQGKGWFEARLPAGTRVDWYVYDAGPGAMEAMLSGALDLAYVGPNPVINAHTVTRGEEVRVVAGSARGGSALVVAGDGPIRTAEDFRGKRLATPQLGNTQDVAARAWLVAHGLRVTQTGGDVTVVPTPNPDQLDLFARGEVAGVWTVEPWVSRLELDAKGRVLVAEDDAVTTLLTSSARALRDRRALVRAFVEAHRELSTWIAGHDAEAKELLRAELYEETRQKMGEALLDRCWTRLRFTPDVAVADLQGFVGAAQAAGFLRNAIPLTRLVEVP